ncbi:hypothetical protein BDQ17DRAFT_1425570 [Cyathus striatus]|nr:hypothetical protein BDQ17DRAFT_1425570 [Cyathus striatus]
MYKRDHNSFQTVIQDVQQARFLCHSSLISSATAAPSASGSIIADGKSLKTGPIAQTPWTFFADAEITSGECTAAIAAEIPDCYTITLPANPHKGQRGQFRTPLAPADGTTYYASWTSNIPSAGVSLFGDEGFHLFELFSSDIGAFSYVGITDNQVFLTVPNGTVTAPTPLSGFTDRNAFHQIELVTGPNGKIDFNVTDKVSGERLLTFLYNGQVGGKDVSFHVGSTRSNPVHGQTGFVENVGQFSYEKRA